MILLKLNINYKNKKQANFLKLACLIMNKIKSSISVDKFELTYLLTNEFIDKYIEFYKKLKKN